MVRFRHLPPVAGGGWEVNGNDTYYLDGKVGIGTDEPDEKLHLKASTNGIDVKLKLQAPDDSGTLKEALLGFDPDKNSIFLYNGGERVLNVDNSGRVGIGTTNPQSKLAVDGKITCKEVEVTTSGWSDFVFEDSYKLRSLMEVESYIKSNKHLPDIPSAEEVAKNGINLAEMDALLLQKIEELTLYMIALRKDYEVLRQEIVSLKSK